MKFARTRNGYSEKEVDEYISISESNYANIIAEKDALISELQDKIQEVEQKERSIAIALTAAVDKAKEIETSSKNIYRLKIEQMTILCSKWEVLLNETMKRYPGIEDVSNIREDIDKLKGVIKNALKDDFNIELIQKNPVTDPIRVLLSRLNYIKTPENKSAAPRVIKRQTRVSTSDKTELRKLEEKANLVRPIAPINLDEGDKFENLVDKFLNSEDEISSAPRTLSDTNATKQAGVDGVFDIKEAINPTEDLEEIMKAFDFYKK